MAMMVGFGVVNVVGRCVREVLVKVDAAFALLTVLHQLGEFTGVRGCLLVLQHTAVAVIRHKLNLFPCRMLIQREY